MTFPLIDNVVIEVDKEENRKSFTSHSVVLRYRSTYFTKELENIATNENHVKTIIKPNISTQIFEIILKYIYGGVVNIENIETKLIYELMIVANELEFEELSEKLGSYLIESKDSWLRTHFSRIYHSIFDRNLINSIESAQKEVAENSTKRRLDLDEPSTDYQRDTIKLQSKKIKSTTNNCNELKGLNRFYNDIIAKHPNLIFESEDFILLQEAELISILENDNLQLEEIKIWDYVVKWGIVQNPTLPGNLEEWSKENFKTLKTTLQQCLPLIRYFHIPEKDIWEKLKPYKKILGTQLWDDLNQRLIFPNQPVKSLVLPARIISNLELFQNINERISAIINEKHVAEISSWIDRKSTIYSLANVPYKLQLILRGSEDGFQPQTFWDMCDGYAGTIVIAKVAGTDEILGGYNPLAWDNSTEGIYVETNDSFIFSLKNGNIRKSILSRVKYKECSLFYHSSNTRIISNLELFQNINERISAIINEKHVAEISSWIDRKSTIYSLANVPYKLQLILRGSEDGFQPQTFWDMCDGYAGTIVIAKVAGTDEILGGYNPLAWDNSTEGIYVETNDSFIFSLKNGNIRKSILSRVKYKECSLFYHSSNSKIFFGPSFGNREFSMNSFISDFTQDKKCWCNNKDFYEKSIRKAFGSFSIVDYEVFKIVKK
ncbi:hypothetical protein Glove_228g48 [Diversispora epigaea]|uniref:BTB domain-containing protein n=1 Tax=Diversispora epigaea TaxID=1348612 RepID=A0A397IGA0_9GLOM|nr:hypothetical protein Glove_228g48 [Diversispora epigaea]